MKNIRSYIYLYIYIYGSRLKHGQSWLKGTRFSCWPPVCVGVCVCVYKCGSISVVSAVSTRSPQLSQSYKRWWWRCAKAFNIKQWYISRVFQYGSMSISSKMKSYQNELLLLLLYTCVYLKPATECETIHNYQAATYFFYFVDSRRLRPIFTHDWVACLFSISTEQIAKYVQYWIFGVFWLSWFTTSFPGWCYLRIAVVFPEHFIPTPHPQMFQFLYN